MDQSYKLGDKQHQTIYSRIEKNTFGSTKSVVNPRVIITGGQPGSGKSKLLELSKREFPDGNVIVINGDDLRNYHPQAERILKADDKRFAERTDPDSREWTRKVFERAIEEKRNIIFESTMRDPGPISKTMEKLKEEGYHITGKVVATHERHSTTGIFKRYEEQKAEKGFGRFSEPASHDAGYKGMPKTVEHIEKEKLVDRLEVYDRSGELLSRNELKDGEWEKEPDAVQVIEAERDREPSEREIQALRSDWQRVYDLMEERQAPAKDKEQAREAYQKIERDLAKERAAEKPKELLKPKLKAEQVFKFKTADKTKEPPKEKSKERDRDDDLSR